MWYFIAMKKYTSLSLILISLLIALIVGSCNSLKTQPSQYTLVYMSSEGGKIIGEQIQIVNAGDDAETVTAVPKDGYEFIGWSDGVETAERTDKNIKNDIEVIAIFRIMDHT